MRVCRGPDVTTCLAGYGACALPFFEIVFCFGVIGIKNARYRIFLMDVIKGRSPILHNRTNTGFTVVDMLIRCHLPVTTVRRWKALASAGKH